MARRLGTISVNNWPMFLVVYWKTESLYTCHLSVLKTGLNIVLACNIPKDSPMLEVWIRSSLLCYNVLLTEAINLIGSSWFQAAAERKLIEKLRGLGYVRPRAGEANTSTSQWWVTCELSIGQEQKPCDPALNLHGLIRHHLYADHSSVPKNSLNPTLRHLLQDFSSDLISWEVVRGCLGCDSHVLVLWIVRYKLDQTEAPKIYVSVSTIRRVLLHACNRNTKSSIQSICKLFKSGQNGWMEPPPTCCDPVTVDYRNDCLHNFHHC